MKKYYISPQITFEPLEDESLMINTSGTSTTSYGDDPKKEWNDTPGLGGDSEAPIVLDPSDPKDDDDY
ncbi:MAG: hypothetical protein IJ183_04965 [Prevotella sp.]|nr:hypothetical protein [Prevotella sp.]